jgi:IclR family KDG regulon transcriptional repressor
LSEMKTLARGLRVLELLGDTEDGLGITELADQLQIDKGSASRMMHTLAKYGFAEKDDDTRRYRLGPKVVTLSRSLLSRMPLRETAKPFLRQLVDETGECAHLGVFSQGKVLYADQQESPATLRVNTAVGSVAPLHCTALGKVLLAFGDYPIPEELSKHTSRTIVNPEMLRYNLEQTRQQGYAIDDEEFDYGVRCIAVPVYDFRDKLVGSIGISGPAARITLDQIPELAKIVVDCGEKLSDRMSFSWKESES